ncbi:MAG: hypothetical protein QKV09_gp3 [Fushun ischnura senegalensis lispivirus 1]|uniref:Uncharacterized protein n=1 Tax=Fushun ischnura senegalensis lispivirus 1 TaxID=2905564 RepID=A0A8K1XFG5_9MONO|nr:MAG: hypothetical protein QKV09_gp3 [Fushun ischnura senegalensis lispivirus 1]UHM27653.1 MAG: hypothetical protein FISLV1_gp3 [Fushun ischnura senegalensis lispivirus 1]
MSVYYAKIQLYSSTVMESLHIITPIFKSSSMTVMDFDAEKIVQNLLAGMSYQMGSPCKLYFNFEKLADKGESLPNNIILKVPIAQRNVYIDVDKATGLTNSQVLELGEMTASLRAVFPTKASRPDEVEYCW